MLFANGDSVTLALPSKPLPRGFVFHGLCQMETTRVISPVVTLIKKSWMDTNTLGRERLHLAP